MPSASSSLLHVSCFAENPYQTESKRKENIFGLFLIFGKKNQHETVPEGATTQGGAPQGCGHVPDPRGHPVRRLLLFFGRKKSNFRRKILAKVSIQSEIRISRYIRNGERAESEKAETERDRETYPISKGLLPLPRHGHQGPEGKPFSHLGRR